MAREAAAEQAARIALYEEQAAIVSIAIARIAKVVEEAAPACVPTTHHSPLTTHHSPLTTHHVPRTTSTYHLLCQAAYCATVVLEQRRRLLAAEQAIDSHR